MAPPAAAGQNAGMSHPPSSSAARQTAPRSWNLVIGIGAAALLFGALAAWWLLSPRASLDALPAPDLTTAEPQVADRISSLRRAVLQDPGSAEAWGRLGMSLDVHGYEREALQAYERATRLDPGDFRWAYFRAVALAEIGDPGAGRALEAAGARRPEYAPAYLRLGRARFDAGDLAGAEAAYRRALVAEPGSALARFGLGRTALARGDPQTARAELHRALERDPGLRDAWSLLADAARRLGDEAEAERAAERARAGVEQPLPDSIYAEVLREGVSARWLIVRGEALLDAGRPQEAERLFRAALAVRPEAGARDKLGLALQFQGLFEEAAEQHRAALAQQPESPVALVNLSSALHELGRSREALETARQAIELDPTWSQGYLTLGLFLARAGRRGEAIRVFRNGLEAAPFDPRLAQHLAWLLAVSPERGVRDGAEAVVWAERVVEAAGRSLPHPLDVLAAAYAEAGRFEEAVRTARGAAEAARRAGAAELGREIETRRVGYEAGRPHRLDGAVK